MPVAPAIMVADSLTGEASFEVSTDMSTSISEPEGRKRAPTPMPTRDQVEKHVNASVNALSLPSGSQAAGGDHVFATVTGGQAAGRSTLPHAPHWAPRHTHRWVLAPLYTALITCPSPSRLYQALGEGRCTDIRRWGRDLGS